MFVKKYLLGILSKTQLRIFCLCETIWMWPLTFPPFVSTISKKRSFFLPKCCFVLKLYEVLSFLENKYRWFHAKPPLFLPDFGARVNIGFKRKCQILRSHTKFHPPLFSKKSCQREGGEGGLEWSQRYLLFEYNLNLPKANNLRSITLRFFFRKQRL